MKERSLFVKLTKVCKQQELESCTMQVFLRILSRNVQVICLLLDYTTMNILLRAVSQILQSKETTTYQNN